MLLTLHQHHYLMVVHSESGGDTVVTDKIHITEFTTWDDIYKLVDMKVQAPGYVAGVRVINFNLHDINYEKMVNFLQENRDVTTVIIPHNLSSVWGIIWQYLCEKYYNDLTKDGEMSLAMVVYQGNKYTRIYLPNQSAAPLVKSEYT